MPAEPHRPDSWDAVIAGAGPVGLLLANLLGSRGLNVLIAEKRHALPEGSMAIGVMPPSLQVLKSVNLDQELVNRGVRVRSALVHGGMGLLGAITFDRLPGDHPFILAVPQAETLRVLEAGLRRFPSVTYRRGVEVVRVSESATVINVGLRDVRTGAEVSEAGRFLAACDGHKSRVRGLVDVRADEKCYGLNFLMADFEDRSGLGDDAHLFLTATGSVESFPLPGGRRRWVVLTDRFMDAGADGVIERLVRERTGHDLGGSPKLFQSPFSVKRVLSRRYFKGRVAFCGDAAHVMSPIGGQGMNTGFADAEFLAEALGAACREGGAGNDLLERYDLFRRKAFRIASARAARGMWLGTRRGHLLSFARDAVIRHIPFRPPLNEALPAYFAMLTIPYGNLSRVPGGLRGASA